MAPEMRRTKIVATLGPATSTPETVRALVEAGMDAARLDMSHGTHADHAQSARSGREVQKELGRPLALIADLQGPKLRIGSLPEVRRLEKGDEVMVVGRATGVAGELPIAPAVVTDILQPGHDVLIDDGLVRLRVEAV